MTADEEVENNASNCKKPKLNDDPFADMRDGGAASMVAHIPLASRLLQTDWRSTKHFVCRQQAERIRCCSGVRMLPSPRWCQRQRDGFTLSQQAPLSLERDFSSLGHIVIDVRSMISAGRVEAIEIARSAILAGLADTIP
jgi:hypothetical protein